MDTMQTNEYPTRYVAFDNPGVMVVQEGRKTGEMAVYSEPMTNAAFPYIEDGIYIEVFTLPNGTYYADCYYSEPTRRRKQTRDGYRRATLADALDSAERWLDSIHGMRLAQSWAA